MKTKNIFFYLTSFVILTLTVSCMLIGNCIEGEGPIVEKELNLANFSRLELAGSSTVFITQSDKQKVFIKAHKNIIDLLNTEVKSDEWEISFNKCIKTNKDIEIYVEIPNIDEISIHGSGDIIGKGLIKSEELELSIAGSGDIKLNIESNELETSVAGSGDVSLSGTTKTHEIEINGSGDIRAFDLASDETKIDINGSGDVKVNTSNSLEVDINGSGDVHYKGAAKKIESSINGSGELRQSN